MPVSVNEALQQISKDFELPELPHDIVQFNDISPIASNTEEILKAIKKLLSLKIKYYIDNDVEKLLHTLYRIDIPESQIEKIFSGSKKEDIPSALSDLIINRQLSKTKTREIYRK